MVRTSRLVFTPAVLVALAAFVFVLVGTGTLVVTVVSGIALLLALGYAAFRRPDLGAD
ncbi:MULTISPECIES: hypothetical protein [Rhodococcus]|uniref:hypothetical protein n=1 Tax=Rhodococcus TaxID=1827 RepID=UPI001358C842|nr:MULTISPECIES: hypothetical protein [Rhodococcus]UOT08378.1 hypothetical protein MPY17_39490 [Rhodococcus opacus]